MQAYIPKTEIEKLRKVAEALSRTTGKCSWDYAEIQAKSIVKTALSITPIAKKRVRKYFLFTDKGNIPVKPYWKDLSKSRGFAKSGWSKAMKSLGIAGSLYIQGRRQGGFYGHYKADKKNTGGILEVGNKIPYIQVLDNKKRIAERAIKNAIFKGEYLLKKIEDRTSKAWTNKIIKGLK